MHTAGSSTFFSSRSVCTNGSDLMINDFFMIIPGHSVQSCLEEDTQMSLRILTIPIEPRVTVLQRVRFVSEDLTTDTMSKLLNQELLLSSSSVQKPVIGDTGLKASFSGRFDTLESTLTLLVPNNEVVKAAIHAVNAFKSMGMVLHVVEKTCDESVVMCLNSAGCEILVDAYPDGDIAIMVTSGRQEELFEFSTTEILGLTDLQLLTIIFLTEPIDEKANT